MTKYRNNDRIAQEEAELEELEKDYKRQYSGEPQETPGENPLDPPSDLPTKGAEEETWKKRHGDLRSYTSRQINELTAQLNEVKTTLADKEREAAKLPTNKTELEQWMKEYPDLTRVLATLIETQTEFVKEDVKTVRQELEAERLSMAKERAINTVIKSHPDFLTLINDQHFKDWVEKQPLPKSEGGRGRIGQALYDALYRNETDSEAAIEAVDVYKSDLAASKPKKDNSAREAALSVKTPSSTPAVNKDGKRTFLESEIDKMKSWDYDKYEDEIEAARRDGRIVYDMSGAAR
jgi:hypothetical protein